MHAWASQHKNKHVLSQKHFHAELVTISLFLFAPETPKGKTKQQKQNKSLHEHLMHMSVYKHLVNTRRQNKTATTEQTMT